MTLRESPHVRWFEQFAKCRCGKPAAGILRGDRNESYGAHCKKCADRRLRDAEKARKLISAKTTQELRGARSW